MIFNRSCVDAVKENRFEDLSELVKKDNAGPGSQNIDYLLAEMVTTNQVNLENALKYASNPSLMKLKTTGIIHTE